MCDAIWRDLRDSWRLTRRSPGTSFVVVASLGVAMAPGELVYEYACHEANYGLEGVLSGARSQEREAARKKP